MKVSYVLKCIPLALMFLLFMPLETRAMDSGYVHIGKENIDNRPLGKNQKSNPAPNLHSTSNNELSKIYQPNLTQFETNSFCNDHRPICSPKPQIFWQPSSSTQYAPSTIGKPAPTLTQFSCDHRNIFTTLNQPTCQNSIPVQVSNPPNWVHSSLCDPLSPRESPTTDPNAQTTSLDLPVSKAPQVCFNFQTFPKISTPLAVPLATLPIIHNTSLASNQPKKNATLQKKT